jgi:hypothetical protein
VAAQLAASQEGLSSVSKQVSKYAEKFSMYDCNGKVEMCATEILFGQERVIIMSCYRSPLVVIKEREWKWVYEQIKGKFL